MAGVPVPSLSPPLPRNVQALLAQRPLGSQWSKNKRQGDTAECPPPTPLPQQLPLDPDSTPDPESSTPDQDSEGAASPGL